LIYINWTKSYLFAILYSNKLQQQRTLKNLSCYAIHVFLVSTVKICFLFLWMNTTGICLFCSFLYFNQQQHISHGFANWLISTKWKRFIVRKISTTEMFLTFKLYGGWKACNFSSIFKLIKMISVCEFKKLFIIKDEFFHF